MKYSITKNISLFRYQYDKKKLFEGAWPIKDGVSVNAYLVQGKEKTALIDYVEEGASFDEELKDLGLTVEDIDILVLNHMEPDHTGGLRDFFKRRPDIPVYCTKVASTELISLYDKKDAHVIKPMEELDLGGTTLTFVPLPNVHWPDTMGTYVKEEGILFSCDAFGAFGETKSVFDDELTDEERKLLETETERYYANIVAPFSNFVLKAIDAASALELKMICPSHGILWRKDVKFIVDWYKRLATYFAGPREKEITMLLSSMYGNTKALADELVKKAEEAGVKMHVVRIPDDGVSFLLEKAWRSEALVVAAPTYEKAMFPEAVYAMDLLARKGLKGRKSMFFGSSLWSGGAANEYKALAEKMALDVVDAIDYRGVGTEADRAKVFAAFDQIIAAVK